MKRILPPALVLFLIAPMVAELLSGSTPLSTYFMPVNFALNVALYGAGAVLIRELTHRWGKGWPTLLTLGLAYGIVEEGLAIKSFFDPNWPDLGLLGSYGRWSGVNWVWTVDLMIYHAVISIGTSVLMVNLMYPEQRGDSWVGPRKFRALTALFLADVIFIFLALTPYRPPFVPYLLAVMIVILLYLLARRLPNRLLTPVESPPARAWQFLALGIVTTFTFFGIAWVPPGEDVHPLLPIIAFFALTALVIGLVLRTSGHDSTWTDIHRWALAAGGLVFFIFLDFALEADKANHPTKNMSGQSLVGIGAIVFLIWLGVFVRRRGRVE
jgi:hypothetical protein